MRACSEGLWGVDGWVGVAVVVVEGRGGRRKLPCFASSPSRASPLFILESWHTHSALLTPTHPTPTHTHLTERLASHARRPRVAGEGRVAAAAAASLGKHGTKATSHPVPLPPPQRTMVAMEDKGTTNMMVLRASRCGFGGGVGWVGGRVGVGVGGWVGGGRGGGWWP